MHVRAVPEFVADSVPENECVNAGQGERGIARRGDRCERPGYMERRDLMIDNYDRSPGTSCSICRIGAEVKVARNDEIGTADIGRCARRAIVVPLDPAPRAKREYRWRIRDFAGKVHTRSVPGAFSDRPAFGGSRACGQVVHGKTPGFIHSEAVFPRIPSPFLATRITRLRFGR